MFERDKDIYDRHKNDEIYEDCCHCGERVKLSSMSGTDEYGDYVCEECIITQENLVKVAFQNEEFEDLNKIKEE